MVTSQSDQHANSLLPLHLEPGVLPHVESPHPQVSEQHLSTGVGHEGPQAGRHGHLQAGEVAPVLHLGRQQLHGHALILSEGLVQQVHCQLPKLTREGSHDGDSIWHIN